MFNVHPVFNIDLRLEVLVQQNVVSIELKAVLVIYNDLFYALEAVHKYAVNVFK